jgi:hypothetical protein
MLPILAEPSSAPVPPLACPTTATPAGADHWFLRLVRGSRQLNRLPRVTAFRRARD